MRNKLLAILFTAMSFFSYTVSADSDSTAPPPITITPADNFKASSGGWELVRSASTTSRVNLPSGSSFVSIAGQLYATNKSYAFTQGGSAGNCTWRVTPTYVSGCSASRYIPKSCKKVPPTSCGANGSCPPQTVCTPAKTVYTHKYISSIYISR